MAQCKPCVKPQIVTPCSSPSTMATKSVKTTGKSLKSPQKSPLAETQTGREVEGEYAPSGKDILEAIKTSSEVLTNKIDALACRRIFNKT